MTGGKVNLAHFMRCQAYSTQYQPFHCFISHWEPWANKVFPLWQSRKPNNPPPPPHSSSTLSRKSFIWRYPVKVPKPRRENSNAPSLFTFLSLSAFSQEWMQIGLLWWKRIVHLRHAWCRPRRSVFAWGRGQLCFRRRCIERPSLWSSFHRRLGQASAYVLGAWHTRTAQQPYSKEPPK